MDDSGVKKNVTINITFVAGYMPVTQIQYENYNAIACG